MAVPPRADATAALRVVAAKSTVTTSRRRRADCSAPGLRTGAIRPARPAFIDGRAGRFATPLLAAVPPAARRAASADAGPGMGLMSARDGREARGARRNWREECERLSTPRRFWKSPIESPWLRD